MKANDITTLVHIAGFLAGALLYGMLGTMTLRGIAGSHDVPRRSYTFRIPLATAVLGLIWNLGGLIIYGLQDLSLSTPSPILVALAFSALGFLPAVVVHSALGSVLSRRGARTIVTIAYACSAVSAVLHVQAALAHRVAPYRPALLISTIGFSAVTALLALYMRRQPGVRRALPAVALAAFAVMALHLSQHVPASDSWPVELVGHHASIPLVLAILYQDYRFAFADLFVKRALSFVLLVCITLAIYLLVAGPLILPRAAYDYADPRATGPLLALWVATALAYPVLQRGVSAFVDRVLLRRANYVEVRDRIASEIADQDSAQDVLHAACTVLGSVLTAGCAWSEAGGIGSPVPTTRRELRGGREHASVHIPTADVPSYIIEVGDLTGGRRLLSGELVMLEGVALILARRIDALRVAHERLERTLRENEVLRLVTEAELRSLRAQLNPHFLFNTLTTIGYLLVDSPARALDTLYRLTDLLRAVLRRSNGEFATLGEEMEIVRSYLAIEAVRFEERLTITYDVAEELLGLRVPPLILQPIVENAIKHGIAPKKAGGRVFVTARLRRSPDPDADTLELSVVDTGVGVSSVEFARQRIAGIGLNNIERRLEHYYPTGAHLSFNSAPGAGATVEICIPVRDGVLRVRGAGHVELAGAEVPT